MTALHLCTIIEGIHARVSGLPDEHKTDDAILPILFEQIAVEFQRLTEEVDEDKRQMQAKLDEFTKRKKARDISKPSHRSIIIRTLQKDKRSSKSRKSTQDSNRKTKRREAAEQQDFGEGKAALRQAEQEQELEEKAEKSQTEGEDAFLKSMKEARDDAVRDQAKAQKLEDDEAFLKSMREAMGEAIREQAKTVLSIKDQALRRQAYEVLEIFRRSMDDEEIARRYADGDDEEEEVEIGGVPLPGAREPDGDDDEESKAVEPTENPWEELFQEIIDEATLLEEKEEKARREIRERQSEVFEEEDKLCGVPLPSAREPNGDGDEGSKAIEPTRDPWEELFQEIIDEAIIVEEKEEKAHREIQERLSEVFEGLRKQFDDDEIVRRWDEDEEEEDEVAFEGVEDTGVPLPSEAEVKEQQKKEALRKQSQEDFKAFNQQFDDDEPAQRWNEAKEAEEHEGVQLPGVSIPEDEGVPLFSQPKEQHFETFSEPALRWNEAEEVEEHEGVRLAGISSLEDGGVPLFSQPTKQHFEFSSEPALHWNEAEQAEEHKGVRLPSISKPEEGDVPLFSHPTKQHSPSSSSASEANSSTRSRSTSASSTSSTTTPDPKPQQTPTHATPTQPIAAPESPKPKDPQSNEEQRSFKPNKSQPLYQTTPLHGHKRTRGTRIAEEHIAKRRIPRTTTSLDEPLL